MEKFYFVLMLAFFSSCEVLQLIDTNQYIQGTCSLILINWKHEHIKVEVDGSEIAIKPSKENILLPIKKS